MASRLIAKSDLVTAKFYELADEWAVDRDITSSTFSVVETYSTTTYNLDSQDVGKYIRFSGISAKQVTVRAEATHALPANGEWHIRNVGSGNLTLVEAEDVTIHPPVSGTLVVEPGGTVTLKRVGVNEFDLIGATVAA